MRLNQLKLLLKTVLDFQMDISVHQGTYTKAKVMDAFMNKGFMSKVEAERRWNQIVLNPGEGSQAYIGYREILSMEKDAIKLKGTAFSSKEFLQNLLHHGAIPLRTLRTRLVEGGVLPSLIDNVTSLPLATRRLLMAAERAGDLDAAFDGHARDMAEELDRRTSRLMALLEPAVIVLMFL